MEYPAPNSLLPLPRYNRGGGGHQHHSATGTLRSPDGGGGEFPLPNYVMAGQLAEVCGQSRDSRHAEVDYAAAYRGGYNFGVSGSIAGRLAEAGRPPDRRSRRSRRTEADYGDHSAGISKQTGDRDFSSSHMAGRLAEGGRPKRHTNRRSRLAGAGVGTSHRGSSNSDFSSFDDDDERDSEFSEYNSRVAEAVAEAAATTNNNNHSRDVEAADSANNNCEDVFVDYDPPIEDSSSSSSSDDEIDDEESNPQPGSKEGKDGSSKPAVKDEKDEDAMKIEPK